MQPEPMVVLSLGEVERVVAGAVARALGTRKREGRLLDAGAAAEQLGVSREAIRRWVRSGRLPHVVLPPTNGGSRGVLRFRRADLETWVARHRRT